MKPYQIWLVILEMDSILETAFPPTDPNAYLANPGRGRHSQRNQPDLLWDGKTIPLEDESIDCAIAVFHPRYNLRDHFPLTEQFSLLI